MCSTTLGLLATLLIPANGPLDLDPDDTRTGLLAQYRSLVDREAVVAMIATKPAFHLGKSSPHPRLPAGPFEVEYRGVITIKDPGPISFSAFVGGELVLSVDGVTLLEGQGNTDTTRLSAKAGLERPPGQYRIAIRFRSLKDVPARLQIWWAGPSFASEPLPAWRLSHVATELEPSVRQDQLAEQGKKLAGSLGCARCHASAFPSLDDPPPGPSLADIGKRVSRDWLIHWLADPTKMRPSAKMPTVFSTDREGFVERWVIAEHLAGGPGPNPRGPSKGDHRRGRLAFHQLGCFACHFVPDVNQADQKDLSRRGFENLADRFSDSDLATFITNPHGRYPDGRMPKLPVNADQGRDISAYLLLWSKPGVSTKVESPAADEIGTTVRRLGQRDARSAAEFLLKDKGCTSCHGGLAEVKPRDVPIRKVEAGCLEGKVGPRFRLTADDHKSLHAWVEMAPKERHASAFATDQNRLMRAGCVQCHQRDGDRPPPIEEAGSKLGGAFLQELPFQKTPRLTNPHQKLTRTHLLATVRDGGPGLRDARYSYRMPAFGADAAILLQAIAQADGELPLEVDPPLPKVSDPTLGTLHGSRLAGFQGYGCVSCHVWNGTQLAVTDPGVSGPDLTKTAGRLRKEWVDRFLEDPLRYYPGTPMPSVFPHGKSATLTNVLDGNSAAQKDALWAYFALGKDAPSPKPPPPVPIEAPQAEGPIVAQIPIRVENQPVEALVLLTSDHDLVVYNLASGTVVRVFRGGQVLRNVQGRIRQFSLAGEPRLMATARPFVLVVGRREFPLAERTLQNYELTKDGFRVRWKAKAGDHHLAYTDEIRVARRELIVRTQFSSFPKDATLTIQRIRPPDQKSRPDEDANEGVTVLPNSDGSLEFLGHYVLGKPSVPKAWEFLPTALKDDPEGSLVRPGYKAIAYPRPKTVSGEDRVMPGAVAVRPRDGQVFIASLKTGELLALRDPAGDGKNARFERYGNGLYQDALSMLAEDDGLYVLHRRNLTKIVERDGKPMVFERVAALPHGIADTYDMAYGLARDKQGRFVFGYAPYANATLPGSGGAIRLQPGKPVEEVAYGMRNPLGWCSGPDGEVFFTDNQGDWVPANKLCHVTEGHYFGWPNNAQKQHTKKPAGKTTVWVPYGWARSINGIAYDSTGGKFGPFAGQIFMAELMYGGAIVRANVEKVNGVYQGACFPFWGKGLLGPVTLAFDKRGPLYVGGVTEPGWMAQPDRGALFRIDYTGQTPFELQSIHIRPRGFRIVFTKEIDAKTALDIASYRLEHYRYEITGAYGSPELDRTTVKVERVELAEDRRSVEIATSSLVTDRVYMIHAGGVRSITGEKLVHPTGAYTLNEVPAEKK